MAWAFVALIVFALPNASAAPEPRDQVDQVSFVSGGIYVEQSVGFRSAAFEPQFQFYTPTGAGSISVEYVSPQGSRAPVMNVTRGSAQGNHVLHQADLAGVPGTPPAGGEAYRVIVAYKTLGNSVELRTFYASSTLVLVALRPLNARVVVEPFQTRELSGIQHGTVAPVAADYTYKVAFQNESAVVAGGDMTKYVWTAGGLLAGALFVWLAARRGMIAVGGSKKFVKGGAMESRSMLDARRRTLLAALKELEHAHEAKEIPSEAYAPLKEEYKAQAVRVMRSLEEKKE